MHWVFIVKLTVFKSIHSIKSTNACPWFFSSPMKAFHQHVSNHNHILQYLGDHFDPHNKTYNKTYQMDFYEFFYPIFRASMFRDL